MSVLLGQVGKPTQIASSLHMINLQIVEATQQNLAEGLGDDYLEAYAFDPENDLHFAVSAHGDVLCRPSGGSQV